MPDIDQIRGGPMQTPSSRQDILELIHAIHNQLEIISGSAHLIGLSPALSHRDHRDLQRIQQAARTIAEITHSVQQQAFSRGQ